MNESSKYKLCNRNGDLILLAYFFPSLFKASTLDLANKSMKSTELFGISSVPFRGKQPS